MRRSTIQGQLPWVRRICGSGKEPPHACSKFFLFILLAPFSLPERALAKKGWEETELSGDAEAWSLQRELVTVSNYQSSALSMT